MDTQENINIVIATKRRRELCRRCYEWATQEEVGPNDLPGCLHNYFGSTARSYLCGERDDCPYFNEDV